MYITISDLFKALRYYLVASNYEWKNMAGIKIFV